MKRKHIIVVIFLALLGFLLYNSFEFRNLEQKRAEDQAKTFKPADYARNFWDNRLFWILDTSVNVQELIELLNTDMCSAIKKGKTLGDSRVHSYLLRGEGKIVSTNRDGVEVSIKNPPSNPEILICTKSYISGNAVRDGKVVGSKPLKQVSHDDVVRMMVGRDIKDFFVKTEAGQSNEAFRVKGIHLAHPDRLGDYLVKDINFSVNKGEVLGLFGLMGAGRTELFETIFGIHPKTASGQIFLEGQELKITSPRVAIDSGIAPVPEDRKLQGLILEMSVGASISLASIEQTERLGFLSNRLEKALAKNYIDRLRIRTASERQVVEALSGGNQQKVVIAKWLATKPRILLLDEPTRGIDVNTKNEIYRLISELAEADLAIIMISSELPEIMTIADRIIVLSEGKQTAEFSRAEASEEAILKAAIPCPDVSG